MKTREPADGTKLTRYLAVNTSHSGRNEVSLSLRFQKYKAKEKMALPTVKGQGVEILRRARTPGGTPRKVGLV